MQRLAPFALEYSYCLWLGLTYDRVGGFMYTNELFTSRSLLVFLHKHLMFTLKFSRIFTSGGVNFML